MTTIIAVKSGSEPEAVTYGRFLYDREDGGKVIAHHLEKAGLTLEVIGDDKPAEFDLFQEGEEAEGYAEAMTYVTGTPHETFEVTVPESDDDEEYVTIHVLPVPQD